MLTGMDYVNLSGTFYNSEGPDTGYLQFVPTDAFEAADSSYQVVCTPFTVQLDGQGRFSIDLVATDSATKRSNTWRWKMTVRTGTIKAERYLVLPKAVPVVDYAQLGEE